MTTFTVICGFATLVGFFLQVKDIFPKYRKVYSVATFILLGFVAGVFAGSFTKVELDFPGTPSYRNVLGFFLYGGTGLLAIVSCLTAIFTVDEARRSEASKVGSGASTFIMLLLLFGLPSFFPVEPSLCLTVDEQIECALGAAKRQDYERSLILLNDAKRSLPASDTRLTNLSDAISDVQNQQAELPKRLLAP